jgi:hypothetical protein
VHLNPEFQGAEASDHDALVARFALSPGTVACELAITPESGTVPFPVAFSVRLDNTYTGQIRRMAGRLNVTIASGASYSNWRGGYTNIAPGGAYSTGFGLTIPALGSVIGVNSWQLVAEDVTPAPYNQPPYPPAGDTCTDTATVTAAAP